MKIIHPRRNEHGQEVVIARPHTPTPFEAWHHCEAAAVVVPNGEMPATVCNIDVAHWQEGDTLSDAQWEALSRGMIVTEPAFEPTRPKIAAGTVIVEPDGRVWLAAPTNAFGGYRASFPKGGPSPGMSLAATALKETFEETGLRVHLISWLVDAPRSQSYTRYYLARRIGGHPGDMCWESQAVLLVPRERLLDWADNPYDKPIIEALQKLDSPPLTVIQASGNAFQSNTSIRLWGGNLVRVLVAIEGFHRLHGRWPTHISMHEAALVDLVLRHLTPIGFFRLQSKFEITVSNETNVVVSDDLGESFDYSLQGNHNDLQGMASAWLGFND